MAGLTASTGNLMMEPLWYAIDRLAPVLQPWVAMLGKVPAGTLTVAALIAVWFAARKLAHVVIFVPGVAAGSACAGWLCLAHDWHPLPGALAGLAVAAALFQILANFLYARLGLAVVMAPLAILAVWHLATGALGTIWALTITATGALTVASLTRRFVNTENHDLYVWARDWIDDLRGD